MMIDNRKIPTRQVVSSTQAFFFSWSLFSLLFLFSAVSPVFSSDFRILPTFLDLGGTTKSGAFTVTNNGAGKLNCQVSVKEWAQDTTGKDVYSDTRDIVFFPKVMTVGPNEQRAIRIGFKGPPPLQEKTYRLFVEEIPSQEQATGGKTPGKVKAGLTIAFRYATPIFVKPAKQQESGVMEKIELSGGEARATIRNAGNIHLKLLFVTFLGKGRDGKELFSKQIAGWYVLRGLSRSFEAAVPKDLCKNIASLEIKAEAENFAMNGTLNVHKEMCGQ